MTSTRWEDGEKERLIRLEGELDHDGCEEVDAAFREATADVSKNVVVDMSEVTFVSSQGIWMMLQAHARLKDEGRVLQVRGMRPHIFKVFETVGVFRAVPEWKP
ncbi:MAG: STAS domain-containing protein [Planctomycetota bacterium]|jgi:anti-anti-sigma factor